MDRIDVVFYYMTDDQRSRLLVSSGSPSNPSLNDEIKDIIDVVAPVDSVTGNRENPITKLLSGSVTMVEKERILSMLQEIPVTSRNDVSDEDLAALLPSRYHNTLTDWDFVGMKYQEFMQGVQDAPPVDAPPVDVPPVDSGSSD